MRSVREGRTGTDDDALVPVASWSRVLPTRTRLLAYDPHEEAPLARVPVPFVPRGAGRSFSDVAYVSGGTTLTSDQLRRVVAFDPVLGTVECESGVSLGALHTAVAPHGWGLAVHGGTRWATVGGAIGNDIHGKDHPSRGSFGAHVLGLTLLAAGGELLEVSPTEHAPLFGATVGGLGLTGLIVRARLALARAPSQTVRVRAEPFSGLTQMRERFAASDDLYQFVSLTAAGGRLRGLHYRADFVDGTPRRVREPRTSSLRCLQVAPPALTRGLTRLHHGMHATLDRRMHVLDVNFWSDRYDVRRHLLGVRGYHEYQLVLPEEHLEEGLEAFYGAATGPLEPQFGVIKRFASQRSPGLLSFPRRGYTFNAQLRDCPETTRFLRAFTDRLIALGGCVYLAKDSCASAEQVERMYPELERWRGIARAVDPAGAIQSDLSRRLRLKPW